MKWTVCFLKKPNYVEKTFTEGLCLGGTFYFYFPLEGAVCFGGTMFHFTNWFQRSFNFPHGFLPWAVAQSLIWLFPKSHGAAVSGFRWDPSLSYWGSPQISHGLIKTPRLTLYISTTCPHAIWDLVFVILHPLALKNHKLGTSHLLPGS